MHVCQEGSAALLAAAATAAPEPAQLPLIPRCCQICLVSGDMLHLAQMLALFLGFCQELPGQKFGHTVSHSC